MAEPIDVQPVKTLTLDDEHRLITKDNLPALQPETWRTFRKSAPVQAIRVSGPFKVETWANPSEPFEVEDGWLAVDVRGYPYAIADGEFQTIYEEQGDEELAPLDVVTNALAAARSNMALVPGTRETALVKTKLDEAWHWLLHHKAGAPLPPQGREVPGTVVRPPKRGGPHA